MENESKRESFGYTAGGEAMLYRLENQNHTRVYVTDYGASLVSLWFKDQEGGERDLVLGYDSAGDYERQGTYFGATVGRNCNRIRGASLPWKGETWKLEDNENGNNLHSGSGGFHRQLWEVLRAAEQEISFFHLNTEEMSGFPGNLRAEVTYRLTDEDELCIDYYGIADKDTVMNFTNHAYFNLGGHDSGSILNQKLQILADFFTPIRKEDNTPTGEILSVEGTPMDFRRMKPIGEEIERDFEQIQIAGGYDHNFVLDKYSGKSRKIAEAYCEKTGIGMEVYTDCCGMQLYTANGLGRQEGKGGAIYENRSGFCLETQFFPNAVNQKGFLSPMIKAGGEYRSRTSYRFFCKNNGLG